MTAIQLHQGNGTQIAIDHNAVLRTLNLNPTDPKTQALLVVCDRYGLDPLLKHMVLIQGTPYVTRDGYLAIAHRSGQFDGMEVLEQTADQTHYIAKVAVYRKDMGRPFTFVGRFPKAKQMAKEYGPEMAVKVAEVQALRRAFNVTGVPAADERWDVDPADIVTAHADVERPALPTPPADVDTETGEVKSTRRRPPPRATEATATERTPDRPPPPEDRPTAAERQAFKSRVEALSPELQMAVTEKVRSKVPNVLSADFTYDHAALLDRAIAEVEQEAKAAADGDPGPSEPDVEGAATR